MTVPDFGVSMTVPDCGVARAVSCTRPKADTWGNGVGGVRDMREPDVTLLLRQSLEMMMSGPRHPLV